jgi:hypothetical protein
VRVRFADMHSVTRSVTLDAPISATAILAEIAEELVRVALADHPDDKTISLLAISLSHLEQHWTLQLELPLGLEDEKRRPGSQRGMARWTADRAIDLIRDRFGWDAVGGFAADVMQMHHLKSSSVATVSVSMILSAANMNFLTAISSGAGSFASRSADLCAG